MKFLLVALLLIVCGCQKEPDPKQAGRDAVRQYREGVAEAFGYDSVEELDKAMEEIDKMLAESKSE